MSKTPELAGYRERPGARTRCAASIFFCLALLLLVAPHVAVRAGASVTTLEDQADDPAGAEVSLREALRHAQEGAVITFALDSHAPASRIIRLRPELGRLVIQTNLAVDASALPGGVTLSGEGRVGILLVDSNLTARLRGLRFERGAALGSSMAGHGNPFRGAAIFNLGHVEVEDCVFAGNQSSYNGGAVYNGRAATFARCLFVGNSGGTGGAISNDGFMNLNDCSFRGNSAVGGATGGAISTAGPSTLVNCTFNANVAHQGGAIYNQNAAMTITHCTVVGNIATYAGGVSTGASLSEPVNTQVRYCIISGNRGWNGDIQGAYSGDLNWIGGSPLLFPFGDYGGPVPTMLPAPGSPVRDVLSGPSATPKDARGFARPDGNAGDLGAVEVVDPNLQVNDADGDGMDDRLESAFGLDPNIDDGMGDLDGDHSPNREEMRFLSNPRDAADRFGLLGMSLVEGPGPSGIREFLLRWRTTPGQKFEIWTQGIQSGQNPLAVGTGITASGGTNLTTVVRLAADALDPRMVRIVWADSAAPGQ